MAARGYPVDLVAVGKGLLAHGMPAKVVGRLLDVPLSTVQGWQKGNRQAGIAPDMAVFVRVRRVLIESG